MSEIITHLHAFSHKRVGFFGSRAVGLVARVVGLDFVSEGLSVDMGIDLRRGYAFVPEHELNGLEVGPAFEQMCGEAVAEGVRADALVDACRLGQLLDEDEDHNARYGFASIAQEDKFLLSAYRIGAFGIGQIAPQFGHSCLTHRHETLLATFAIDAQERFVEEEIAELQPRELAHSQSAAVEYLQHGTIALPCRGCHVDGTDEPIDLLDGEYRGQVDAYARAFEQLRGVVLDILLKQKEAEEALDAADDTRYRAGTDAEIVELGYEVLQVVVGDFSVGFVLGCEIRG